MLIIYFNYISEVIPNESTSKRLVHQKSSSSLFFPRMFMFMLLIFPFLREVFLIEANFNFSWDPTRYSKGLLLVLDEFRHDWECLIVPNLRVVSVFYFCQKLKCFILILWRYCYWNSYSVLLVESNMGLQKHSNPSPLSLRYLYLSF